MNTQPPSKRSKPGDNVASDDRSASRKDVAFNSIRVDSRRHLALASSILCLLVGLWLRVQGDDSSLAFTSGSMLRIGFVFGTLWIAWPSLRRPAQWLAPGMALIIVLTLVVIAANPRLALVAVPAAGSLITIGAVIRMFRSSK
jgi:hypothetical protein